MEVWYLAKDNLDAGKNDHKRVVRCIALVLMTMFVKAVRPFHRADWLSWHMVKKKGAY